MGSPRVNQWDAKSGTGAGFLKFFTIRKAKTQKHINTLRLEAKYAAFRPCSRQSEKLRAKRNYLMFHSFATDLSRTGTGFEESRFSNVYNLRSYARLHDAQMNREVGHTIICGL